MHDHSTRAAHHRRHRSAKSFAAVAAVLFLLAAITLLAPQFAQSATSDPVEVSSAPAAADVTAPPAAHDVAIETVPAGSEGLELSARLDDDGGIIELPVAWEIASAAGELVYRGEVPVAGVTLKAGDYHVDIRYGAVHLAQGLTVAPRTRLIVSFVLDAGGIRILPRLKGLGLPATPSHSRIYALGGVQAGTMIASSDLPGEVLRVPAGRYRIESRFEPGNARAVTDVTVKPGLMTAVDIDHVAGLARLALVGAPEADVLWRLADAEGNALPPIAGSSAEVVLRPGTYTAVAEFGHETRTAQFAIGAGESREVILGN